jgi:nitrile hydratase accessory protein
MSRIPRLSGEAAVPLQEGEPVFQAPWEARAFAMALALFEQGQYSWKEFQEILIDEIGTASAHGARAGTPAPAYYEHWLRAFEQLLSKKGVILEEQLEARASELTSTPSRYDDHEDEHDDHQQPGA